MLGEGRNTRTGASRRRPGYFARAELGRGSRLVSLTEHDPAQLRSCSNPSASWRASARALVAAAPPPEGSELKYGGWRNALPTRAEEMEPGADLRTREGQIATPHCGTAF